MSDNEYDMEWDSGEDQQENGNDSDVEIQNNFYEAEGNIKQNPQDSLEKFETVIMMEESSDDPQFSFHSLKYVVVLSTQLGLYDKMLDNTNRLLRRTNNVSKNEISEAVTAILDSVRANLSQKPDHARQMYQLILGSLRDSNERLWFATSLRLGKIYLDEKNLAPLNEMILELKKACRTPEAIADDIPVDNGDTSQFETSKGNILLEVYALEIQMCIETREQRRMKEIFSTTKKFSSVIEDPRINGIIKECGGKMYMSEKWWDAACNEFYESYKCFVDVGQNDKAQVLLKYVVLASLLSGTEVDYLGTREAKIFAQDKQIQAMKQLKQGFDTNDIRVIQEVLADKEADLLSDPFINTYLDDLLRRVRLKALEAICKPYKTVKLSFLAESMNVTVEEIRSLLSELILEEKLEGKMDQVNGFLELSASKILVAQKHRAMQTWSSTLLDIHKQLAQKIQASSSDDMYGGGYGSGNPMF